VLTNCCCYYIKRDYLKNTDATKLGVGGWGKYPGASPHIKKGKRGKKPTARYLTDQYGEKGKAIYRVFQNSRIKLKLYIP
jgi:hypothetical protein